MSRNDPKDPLVRSLVLLGLIPRYPKSASVQELKTALEQRGFSVTARTLQRDLGEKLSTRFPLISQNDGQTLRWSFDSQAQITLPATDTAAALAMNLAEGHLKHLLPPGVLALLEPQFATARNHLQSLQHNPLTRWAQRVRSLPNGKTLLPASVDGQVWESVATALLEQRQLQVDYFSRVKGEVKTMTLHPKGLASRGPASYLIASVGDYTDVRHFALHRIQRAEVLIDPTRDDDFDMDAYLPTAAFTPRQGTGMVELVADVHPDTAWILRETPLSEEQTLDPLPENDWLRLRVRVADDQETLWWVLGLGASILVHEPASLQKAINNNSKSLHSMYSLSSIQITVTR
ncbi:WYL domain-containing protein [Stenotrophomonas sp. STM01]|uniref:helix-turn-helix transcriptional regulator n=1 Tax=Stenotrophomonas sp. STM01 TaxID=2769278 RepID=UPI00177C1FA6|nr:WYL domain-containing protein [Stenotrophomonas sp. STM01]MBD9537385.1 WYL domain-containing protein [Stenotrophomonas sp. STM01]